MAISPISSTSTALIIYTSPQERMKPFTSKIHTPDLIDINFSAQVNPAYAPPVRFCFDSNRLVPTKTSTREPFDLSSAIERNGKLVKTRTIQNHLDIYIFANKTYLVWNNGCLKGHIYRVLTKDETLCFRPPSLIEFEQLLKTDSVDQIQDCAYSLFEGKHGDYYLWQAQYFSFPQENETIIDYFTEIQNIGFQCWVETKIKKTISIKRQHLRPETYSTTKPSCPIYLFHGTFSDKIPAIIQMGGLASAEFAYRFSNITKSRGGELGGKHAHSSTRVSFWHSLQGQAQIVLGFGEREGFEYPVTFAVGEKSYKDPTSYDPLQDGTGTEGPCLGGFRGEVTVRSFWPIERIDYIFVPPFAVRDMQQTLKEHGLVHIQVHSY